MATNDEQLLDFDKDRLAHWNQADAEQALAGERADLYRNHLAIAHWIDGYAQRLEEGEFAENPTDFNKGYLEGIRDLAAHLRQADLLPDGTLLAE
ncbi:hypothetical protein [Kitasatospora sp. NPDC001132]